MDMANKRKKFSPEEKVRLLRLHLIEKGPVSDICDRHGLNPNVFYRWQKIFFENGAAAFAQTGTGRKDSHAKKLERQNAQLIAYYYDHPLEGYRRLTYMMMDDDIVAVSPSSVYRVLKNAGLMQRWDRKASKKAPAFISLANLMSTGTLTFRTLTFAAHFITCAAY